MPGIEISMVTATYNRPQEIQNLLRCVADQTYPAKEIIVVDATPNPDYHQTLLERFRKLPLRIISSSPSVCVQRNIGIKEASSEWIFLCDDDIEFGPDYVEKLVGHIEKFPPCDVVTGSLLERNENDDWTPYFAQQSKFVVLWRFIFQQPIWGPIRIQKIPFFLRPVYHSIAQFYKRRGNSTTLAGWPLITNWQDPFTQTKFYSLGTNLIRRSLLINNLFDEVLDSRGIGDNYGVERNFPGAYPIHILSDVFVKHYVSKNQRISSPLSYYRRIIALEYFVETDEKYSWTTKGWFLWSLIGNGIRFLFKGHWQYLRATFKAFFLVAFGRNPYVKAKNENERVNEIYF